MITQSELKELLEYNPVTGQFIRKISRGRFKVGEIAGSLDKDGYNVIMICNKNYKSHRLAWLYMMGNWPDKDVDHIDNDPQNNAWKNLREATESENICNSKLSKANKSGIKGVSWDSKLCKWRVQLQIDGKAKFLGSFNNINEAKNAIDIARKEYHKEFANHG